MKRLSSEKSNAEILLELINKNYQKVADFLKEVYKDYFGCNYDVDIYAYLSADKADFELDTFSNPGGNSWLNDGHFYLYSFKNNEDIFDWFNSYDEFISYMIEDYDVVLPNEIMQAWENEEMDDIDVANYIIENYSQIDQVISDVIDETWDCDYIMETIIDKLQQQIDNDVIYR